MKIFYRLLSFITSIILLLLIFNTIFYVKNIKSYNLDINKVFPSSSIKIYDKDNNLISNEGYITRTYVYYNDISPNMINAIISIEDKDFYKHNGISYKGIVRATLKNIKSLKFKEGASTITQQLIKNTILKNEKSLERKINEINLSLKIEKLLTKEQIIEAYLNNILYGNNIYGIFEASKYYFNKEPINLTISEAALLSGLIQLPNYYNPFKNYDKSIERRNVVLQRMYKYGYITQSEYNHSINDKVILNKKVEYQSYKDMFYDYLYEYINDNNLSYEKCIKTSFNKYIQKDIFELFQNKTNLFNDDKQNCAVVVINNKTMKVEACGTNRALKRGSLNYITTPLQPGSTIKPILDYAPAIEYLNLSPATILLDEPCNYNTGEAIHNWDNNYKGYITLRYSLATSRNIPALKLFNLVGAEKVYEFAEKLGITSSVHNESDAIGGSFIGYTLLDLTNAYTAFARLGRYKKASPIIELDNKPYETSDKIVMKESTAFLINNILHDVLKNSKYDLKDRYLMAKTGQTNFDKATKIKYSYDNSRVKDSLCIGYTKDYTVGVWTGYNNNKYALTNISKDVSKKIVSYILDKYSNDTTSYEIPNNLIYLKVKNIDDTLYLSNNGTYDFFIKGSEPILDYEEAKKIGELTKV